jgi:riboflavin synthase
MFTGIIETTGVVTGVSSMGTNRSFWVQSPVSAELKIDQSVSHNGVCLTVEEVNADSHRVTAIEETIKKTNLGHWQAGTVVNIERCLQLTGRLDGHLVQGHVDATAVCTKLKEKKGSWEFTFQFAKKFAPLVIEKGSICLNGISLTVFNLKKNRFTVAVIPYTFEHTNIRYISESDQVNIEFDMVGKYIQRKITIGKLPA